MQLLDRPERRPVSDAKVWLKDGWQLITKNPLLWVQYSSIGFGVIIIASLIGGLLGSIFLFLGELGRWLGTYAELIPMALAGTILQTGAFRLMAALTRGEKPNIKTLFWLVSFKPKQAFIQYAILALVVNGSFAVINAALFPEPLVSLQNGKMIVANPEIVLYASAFSMGISALFAASTWGILPVLSDFPRENFAQVFRLQLRGTFLNWKVVCVFAAMVILAALAVMIILSALASLSSLLVLFLLLFVWLFAWPLTLAWSFSAARHMFMTW